MSLNSLKKMIIFSNEKTKLLVENLVKDDATVKKRSASAIIEDRLLDSFLPQEKNARFWVANYLYCEDYGIGKTLDAIFSYNNAGINWNSKYDNLLPLVEFACTYSSMSNATPTGNERERHHCISQLKDVVHKLSYLSENATDHNTKRYYEAEAKRAQYFLDELDKEPEYVRYFNIFNLIYCNWEDLKDWSITYRLLADLSALEKGWLYTAETKTELLQIIKDVTNEWMNSKG